MRSRRHSAEGDDELFLVEGVLTELHVELGRQNLLEKIDKHYRGKSAVTGAGVSVGDMFGQAANAAALAMYDGEDTQNFACLVDDRIVCGQFAGAEFLQVGNRIKAIVAKRGGVLAAGAIMDEAQGYLWIGHPWGERAEMLGNLKLGFWVSTFAMCCLAAAAARYGTGTWTFWETMIRGAGALAALCVVVAVWSNHDMRALSGPSTEMFRLLGFADPAGVNLNGYRLSIVHRRNGKPSPSGAPFMRLAMSQKHDVCCYKLAIEDRKISMASQ